jgi:hypothetical protein
MIWKPWPYTQRIVDRMADSSLQNLALAGLPRAPRSEGLHASTLLKLLHPSDPDNGISEAELRIYGLLGLAFEDRAELALLSLSSEEDWPWECYRPDEVMKDGIACSPDIMLVPKTGAHVRELSLKVTWKSAKDAPDGHKFQYYVDQCLTYASPLNTMASVLLVYFVNGDYSHMTRKARGARIDPKGTPPKPLVRGYELDFSRQERAEMWAAMLGLKTQYLKGSGR